jgi:hypothetical protein
MASPTAWAVRCRRPSARCRGPRRISCPARDSTWPIPMAAPRLRSAARNFVAPATVLTVQSGMRPPYSQNWNLSIERASRRTICSTFATSATRARICRASSKRIPAIYGPGVNANNNNQIRQYTTCNSAGVCNYGSVGLLADDSSSTYHALEVAFSRQYAHGLSFLASYWYSKSLDYISTLNVAGSAPTLVAGENDLAQNPFDLAAEHGPSLFDATHRFVFSGTWALPKLAGRFAGRGLPHQRLAVQRHRQPVHRHAVYRLRQRQRFPAGQRARNQRLLLQPARPDFQSERGAAAHAERMGEPRAVPATEPANAGGPVRQRGPQCGARSGHRRRRCFVVQVWRSSSCSAHRCARRAISRR